jgi:PAS domain S-box-containing protein
MSVNNVMMFCFDSGIDSPIHFYVFYLPLLLSNFIVIDPARKAIRITAFCLTLLSILSTLFFNFTPQLSLEIFPIAYKDALSYFNLITAITITVVMIQIILKKTEQSEQILLEKQKVLASKEQLLYSINQNISEGLYRSDNRSDKMLYVNNAFAELFGYSSEDEVMALGMHQLYVDVEQRLQLIEKIKSQRYLANEEIRFRRKNRSEFWGLLSCVLTIDESGNEYCDGAIRDITHIKEIEYEVIVAKQAAENASLAKTKFLSAMSHEIRTPMNAVIGIANLMSMNEEMSRQEKENILVLKSSAENLMSLLNDLLDMNKIEAGKFELNYAYTDLDSALHELSKMYAFLARQKQIEWVENIHLERLEYRVDVVRLIQVLGNLLSNAVKFTDKGYIKLNVGMVRHDGNQCKIRFAVEDTGIGISKAYQNQIFSAFAQGKDEIARRFGGTGLGLTISRNILRKMDSGIEVYSEEGKGAVFTFELTTLCREKDHSQNAAGRTVPANLEGMHILLVEDNHVNIVVAKQLLERWGVQLLLANNGIQALEQVKLHAFDAILMDLHMPEMDGFEATLKIRELGIETPIIALTADAISDSKEQSLLIGMVDYITKPFNPDELFTKLSRYHSGHRT